MPRKPKRIKRPLCAEAKVICAVARARWLRSASKLVPAIEAAGVNQTYVQVAGGKYAEFDPLVKARALVVAGDDRDLFTPDELDRLHAIGNWPLPRHVIEKIKALPRDDERKHALKLARRAAALAELKTECPDAWNDLLDNGGRP